ncbi:MAG: AMP-binding protein, partial [Bifidobacteriaceae bacterium]|nr:AMP-binding protein [Bifidobacteriaceae bacterium]
FFAVLRLGGIVVEHNPTYTTPQYAHQLSDSGATHVLVWDKATPAVLRAVDPEAVDVMAVAMTRDLPALKRGLLRLPLPAARRLRKEMGGPVPAGATRWERLTAAARPIGPDTPGPGPDNLALLQYTGGTTGTPRGAMVTHRNLAVNAVQSIAWVPLLRGEHEVFYGALPFFHAFGLSLSLAVPVALGALLVVFPKFDAKMILAAQRRVPGTFFAGVPPMFDRLEKAAAASGRPLTSFVHSISGAMSLDPGIARRWEKATGGMLMEGYGLTETSPVALGNPASPLRRPGALGLPFPSTWMRVADPEAPENDVEPGRAGELLLRGPQVFQGYWNRPEETAAAFTADGWLRTGDVVEVGDDGFVTLVDRIKEIIITGGFNVYPSDVERSLAAMPEIAEVAVVGLPGGDLGERVAAAVVLAPGAHLDIDKVREWCLQRLSRYAIPRELVFLTELPRSQVGKVLRRAVRASIVTPSATPESI